MRGGVDLVKDGVAVAERSGAEDVPIIKGRVIRGSKAPLAMRQAELMGGVLDPVENIWSFRATKTFELKGGVMRLRRAGLLPLELWSQGRMQAVWVDYEWAERIMQWRPLPQ